MAKYQGHYSSQNADYMGAWSYVGLMILYLIPIIGTIFLLVHACSKKHENRCHFARSYFCWILLAIILIAIAVGALVIAAMINGENVSDKLNELWNTAVDEYNAAYERNDSLFDAIRSSISQN